jgi:membrane-bound lytic murein transglycosylase B
MEFRMNRILKNILSTSLLFIVTASFGSEGTASQLPLNTAISNNIPAAESQKEHKTLVNISEDEQKFVETMVEKYQLDSTKMTNWIAMAETKQSIIDAMNRPAEGVLSWAKYSKIFLTKRRLKEGLEFWRKYQKELTRAEQIYGVPAEMIVAIIGVETFYGRIKGNYRVLDALYTLGFHFPKRAKFFKSELGHFFRLTEQQGWQPESRIGSYAGAMGYGQFMPSSYISYAVDFDNDGATDLINNPVDAIGSVANYFKRHGWKKDQDVIFRVHLANWKAAKFSGRSTKTKYSFAELKQKGVVSSAKIAADTKVSLMTFDQESKKEYWMGLHNFYVISRYNHSHMYSLVTYKLSQQLKQAYKPELDEVATKTEVSSE